MARNETADCLISLGSNLGRRDSILADAAGRIAGLDRVLGFRASRLFETPPIGGPGGQEPFLNAVATFRTTLSAAEVLTLLQATEDWLGRRRHDRWGSRSIDLDVVLHGELMGGSKGLVVPHPRYTARRFVLQPALDVAALYRDPRFGWTIAELAAHVETGLPSLALTGGDQAERKKLLRRISRRGDVATFDGVVDPAVDRPWVSGGVETPKAAAGVVEPRLIARIEHTTPATRWPAAHQIWPTAGRYPEYRLELDDLDWAADEVIAALAAMRCPCRPVSEDGGWAGQSPNTNT